MSKVSNREKKFASKKREKKIKRKIKKNKKNKKSRQSSIALLTLSRFVPVSQGDFALVLWLVMEGQK